MVLALMSKPLLMEVLHLILLRLTCLLKMRSGVWLQLSKLKRMQLGEDIRVA
jgi:hypothetical protein